MNGVYVEIVRRIYQDNYYLAVCRSVDVQGYVNVIAEGGGNKSFWGNVDLSLPPEMAVALAEALLAAAKEDQS